MGIGYKLPDAPDVQLAAHDETIGEEAVKMSLVKMAFGGEGEAVPVTEDNPMPVSGSVSLSAPVEIINTVPVEVINTVQVRDADGSAEFINSTTFTSQVQFLSLSLQAKHKKIRIAFSNETDASISLSLAIKGIGPGYETAGVRTITVPAGACESMYFDGIPVEMRLTIDPGWSPTLGACPVQVYGWK